VDQPGTLGPPWTDGGADRGGAIERGEHRELGSGLTRARAAAWRPGDGGGAKRSRETRRGVFPARERRGEGRGEVWGAPGVIGVAFIGPGEGAVGVAEVTAG
jgi:hypothetical protein